MPVVEYLSWAQFLHWFDHEDHHASRHSCTLQPKSTSSKARVRLGYRSWGPKELTGYNLKENYQLGRYVDSPCRFHSRFSSSALAFGISFPFFPLFSAYFVFTSLGVAYIIVCGRNDRHCSPLCPSLFLLSLHAYSLRCIFGPQLIASFHPIACIIMSEGEDHWHLRIQADCCPFGETTGLHGNHLSSPLMVGVMRLLPLFFTSYILSLYPICFN